MSEPALEGLIDALRRLPGVGVKSAQRMAYHLLQHDRDGARRLAGALTDAMVRMQHCSRCHTFTQSEVCDTCLDGRRDARQLCVVESPADQAALERSGSYKGLYFVLLGRLNPLQGVGPGEIGVDQLLARVDDGAVEEVILATSFTAEGEVTAQALAVALKVRGIKVTRLSRGVPAGGELEYVDLGTLAYAMGDRR